MVWQRLFFTTGTFIFLSCSVIYSSSPRYDRLLVKKKVQKQYPRFSPKYRIEEEKGKLPWPVFGSIVGQFGLQVDPKYNTKTRNSGIDISCKKGSPVKAIGKGVVSYADFFMGQGLMVIVEHGGGFHSIYSRLDELKVHSGRMVDAGDIVGLSSDVLHFELRIGGKAVDPREWLEKK
ncbi:MAG: murein hydrolase activator EnvC family protein [Candidatus Aminicenantales bacterium]